MATTHSARPFYLLITAFLFVQIVSQIWPKHHHYRGQRSLSEGWVASIFKRGVDDLPTKCEDVWEQPDRCLFVQQACGDYPAGLINYLHFYYCDLESLQALALVLMAAWMIFLFALVGIAASDFFCPNLNTIAKKLRLSESLTGVTFLAFGNASPDIFSTFSAMGSGSASLAIGEVAGSASFVTSVVVGSMAIICPFQVGRAAFLRDIAFFMGCILFTMFMVIDGKITFVESILLIIVYIAYVSTVVFGNQKPKPVTTVDDMDEVDSRQNHSDPETGRVNGDNSSADEHGNTEVTATPTRTQPLRVEHSEQAIAMPTITLSNSGPQIPVITLNPSYNPKSSSRRCPAILYHPGNINTDPKRLGYAAVNREESPSPVTPVPDDQAHDPSYSLFQQALLHHSLILPDPIDPVHRRPSPSLRSRSFESPRGEVIEMFPQETCFEKVTTAFFPTLQDWHEKKLVVKILAIASAPIVLLLTLTLPVVDLDDNQEDPISGEREVVNSPNLLSPISEQPMQECPAESQYNSWCRTSATVQMILAPAFLTAVVTSAAGKSPFIIAVSLAGGVTLALVLRISSTEAKPPKFFEALAFVGFLVAVAWIFLVANEVVGILQAIGMILGLSDAILGLTVFAMGNSLGDLVANITIAKLGFPRMAFSACFGSPLLNMLLGVGISGVFVTSKTKSHIPLDMSPTLLVSLVGVLFTLVLALVVVPRNGYILGRWWGWFLISVYLVCMVTNVVLEVKVPSHRL